MKLEKDLIITLEDGSEYYVISTAEYNNERYAYLMNMNEDNYYVYAKEINDNGVIKAQPILDKELIQKISLYLEKEIA